MLQAATKLFYRAGIHQTGIDLIIAEAGVAKASFYDHFKSKDELIAAYVHDRDRWFKGWFGGELARGPSEPRARLAHALEIVGQFTREPSFCGCAFIAAIEEIQDRAHPARQAAEANKAAMRGMLVDLAREAGLPEAEKVGAALMLLIDGVLIAARQGGSEEAMAHARWTLAKMIG